LSKGFGGRTFGSALARLRASSNFFSRISFWCLFCWTERSNFWSRHAALALDAVHQIVEVLGRGLLLVHPDDRARLRVDLQEGAAAGGQETSTAQACPNF
jgi:hypothetical protein